MTALIEPIIEEHISLVEEILSEHRTALGNNYPGYRNHVYRMINFCLVQREFSEEDKRKIIIAGCFHDLGIWTGDTFDYIPPSIELASQYLAKCSLDGWISEIKTMIDQHHKLRRFKADSLTEVFRRGDLVDFSLGVFKCGVPAGYIKTVKSRFPNAGFHKFILSLAGGWICRHPLNPVPVLKW